MLLLVLIGISSCTMYYQVADVSSVNIPQHDKTFVFENDTVRITYAFWAEKGILGYTIYNKTDKPIYVDWKKSSYVRNDDKIDYYNENERITATTTTRGRSSSSSVTGQQGAFFGNTVSGAATYSKSESYTSGIKEKQERVTFIAPKSQYTRADFAIGRQNGVVFSDTLKSTTIERLDAKGKYTRAFIEKFTLDESPIVFRVFLSLSTREDFASEFYIDNGFYVSRVMQINGKQFASNWEYESPYFRETRYYTTLKTE